MAAIPTHQELLAKVPDFRKTFLEKHAGSIGDGTYDVRDIDHFKSDDVFASVMLKAYKSSGDIEKGCNIFDTVLKFRKEWGVNDLSIDQFPEEFHQRLFFKGVGKDGSKILHFKVKSHKKGQQIDEVKHFIAHRFNEHYSVAPNDKIIVMFDFNDAGLSNMDLDVTKFIISCLSTYYPACCQSLLMFEMPFILEAIWKIIKAWLDAEQKKAVTFVKKNNIQEHIAADQLEPHMIKKK